MTRLSRWTWVAVLASGLLGLLLSLVTLTDSPEPVRPVAEVRGEAAVAATDETSHDEEAREEPAPARRDRVGRSPAALPSSTRTTPRPVQLRLPAIGLSAPVDALGVGTDGQMRLPPDPRRLGWYRFGAAPGSGTGSAVLAGHVDSVRYGVGPLARLVELRPGDTVDVRLASGAWRRFRVDSIEAFERQALPEAVFTRTGPERLRLVTCTGPYLPALGGYQQNLVVTAVPV